MLTEPGQPRYPLPEGFRRMRSVHISVACGLWWYELRPMSPKVMSEAFYEPDIPHLFAMPRYYCVTDELVLAPRPDGEYEIALCWEGEECPR